MKDLMQLIEDLKSDEQLCAKIAAVDKGEDAINAILAEEGYAATVADMKEYAAQKKEESFDEEDLRKVAGGGSSIEVCSEVMSAVAGFGVSCWIP